MPLFAHSSSYFFFDIVGEKRTTANKIVKDQFCRASEEANEATTGGEECENLWDVSCAVDA